MSSIDTARRVPGGLRQAGAEGMAQASDAQADRITRFCPLVSVGSFNTSAG
jgi:hypothetical protein